MRHKGFKLRHVCFVSKISSESTESTDNSGAISCTLSVIVASVGSFWTTPSCGHIDDAGESGLIEACCCRDS